jgi:hypothetical protein
MHKIPGTPYAPPPSSTGSTSPLGGAPSGGSFGGGTEFEKDADAAGRHLGGAARDAGDDTFRARMEKLKDEDSTNLYFEGWAKPFPFASRGVGTDMLTGIFADFR